MTSTITIAEGIAQACHAIRPDWPTSSITAIIINRMAKNHPPEDVSYALIKAARDSEVKTPGIILTDERFWPGRQIDGIHFTPVRDANNKAAWQCPHHDYQPAENCPCCYAEYSAGEGWPEGTKHHLAQTGQTGENQ